MQTFLYARVSNRGLWVKHFFIATSPEWAAFFIFWATELLWLVRLSGVRVVFAVGRVPLHDELRKQLPQCFETQCSRVGLQRA